MELDQYITTESTATTRVSFALHEPLKHLEDEQDLLGRADHEGLADQVLEEEPIIKRPRSSQRTYESRSNGYDITFPMTYPTGDLPGSRPIIKSVPFVLSFNNLTYSVKTCRKMQISTCFRRKKMEAGEIQSNTSTNTKILLNDISGETKEGEILAVLGASGAGKSTLIDALANRIDKGSLKGSVTLNGEVLESKLLKAISAYVMQDDLLYPMLTVEETLMFSAECRLPRSLSKSNKKARVQAVINQLGLQNAATTVIGDEGHRGVSGGERRRVTIGVDIIHDPIILFLDEPTSGLDSTSAFLVVQVLQKIAQSGSIVIMSVHQPSYRILGLLDHLIFLSRGQTVYNGSPKNLPVFFSELGHPIPENENWSEFALDTIGEFERSPCGTKRLVELRKSLQNMYHQNSCPGKFHPSLQDDISASISRGKLAFGDVSSTFTSSTFANPFWIEIFVLAKRSMINSSQMPELFGVRFAAILFTSLILAMVYWQLDNSPKGVQERLGFLAFLTAATFFTSVDTLPVFLHEQYIFMRETSHNAYRRWSYVLANTIVAFPTLVLLSATFAITTFWAVGLAGGVHGFFFYFFTLLAGFWVGNSFMTFLSGVVPNVMIGNAIVMALFGYFLLFSGFFINRDRIPLYWIWFHYISLLKYPFESNLQNEFENPSTCFIRAVQMFDNTPLKMVPIEMKVKFLNIMSDTSGMILTPDTCLTTGVDILGAQGVTSLSKWNCLWITVAWGFFFRILFYISLLGSKNKRK